MQIKNVMGIFLAMLLAWSARGQQRYGIGQTALESLITGMPTLTNSAAEAFRVVYRNDRNTVASLYFDALLQREEDMIIRAKESLKAQADSLLTQLTAEERVWLKLYPSGIYPHYRPIDGAAVTLEQLKAADESQRRILAMQGAAQVPQASNRQVNNIALFADADIERMIRDPAYAAELENKIRAMNPAELERWVRAQTSTNKAHKRNAEADYESYESMMHGNYTHSRLQYFDTELATLIQQFREQHDAFQTWQAALRAEPGAHHQLSAQAQAEQEAVSGNHAAQQALQKSWAEKHVTRSNEELRRTAIAAAKLRDSYLRVATIYRQPVFWFEKEAENMRKADRIRLQYQFFSTETILVDMASDLLKIYRETMFDAASWYHASLSL